MNFYIYRVGWTYPAKNPIISAKSIKIPNCTQIPLGPVRPTGQIGRSCQTGYRCFDRSDRLSAPVRPVCTGCCQFWLSTYALLFFGKACVPKNTLLDQNCLRAMNTSVIFCAKGDNNLSAVSCFFFKLMTKQLV